MSLVQRSPSNFTKAHCPNQHGRWRNTSGDKCQCPTITSDIYRVCVNAKEFNCVRMYRLKVGSFSKCLSSLNSFLVVWTHWGQVTHICISKPTIIGSNNGLSPVWLQTSIWTNAGILLIRTLKITFQWNLTRNSYILIEENVYDNIVCEITASLPQPQSVQHYGIFRTLINSIKVGCNILFMCRCLVVITVWYTKHTCIY